MESHWSVFYPEKYSNPKTDSDETLYMRIKRVCLANPARIALEYGTTKITFASFLDKINEAASTWKKLGVEKGDVVMIAMGNNPINIISVYALDKIGASAALAVPNLATEYFAGYAQCVNAKFCVMSCNQYLNYSSVLAQTGIKTVVIGKYSGTTMGLTKFSIRFYPLYSYDKPKPKNIPEGIKLVYWEDVFSLPKDQAEQEEHAYDRDNNRTALYLFPSVPTDCKATELTARSMNISANLTEMVFKADEDMTGMPVRTLCLNECCFAFGFVVGIHNVLCCAQTVTMFTWYDSDKIFFAMRKYRPDVIIGYNSTIASLNKAGNTGVLRTVNRIIVGGGLLTSSQKATLFENAQNSGRKLAVCSITGCDEILAYAYGPSDLDSDRLLGFPLPGVIMRIANKETGLDVPEGAEGEIAVCTPIAATADVNSLPTENYRKLLDGRIWFFTGIIGKQDGNKMFYLVGTKSREARINSYPVYPDKVDETVQMTEGVVESCTVIIEKPEGPVLITAVVPQEEYFYDNNLMEDLRDRIKSDCEMTLHEAMRPSEVIFLVSLPRDSKGVKDYEAVKEKVTLMQDEEVADDEVIESEETE
ncbi:MAG: acyl--CoA ligase [Clostridiales bacterium]|nr:acyl--CoA ligase [Clostridiales bacterium]